MKKRTCAAVAAVSVLLSAIITFQITSTTYRAKNKAELDSLKTEYESSFGGKMNALHDDFLSLYNGDVDEEQLDELSMKYFVFATGDRYGEYLTADEFAELEAGLEGDFVGIGVSVIEDSDSGLLEVVDVFPDSPAASVGMQPGDLIYKVGDDYAAEIARRGGNSGHTHGASRRRGADLYRSARPRYRAQCHVQNVRRAGRRGEQCRTYHHLVI